MDYQIAAPGDHRLKFSERSIQMFKNNFVSIIHGCDRQYLSNQWDSLIQQAVIILMVRPSRINPKLSEYNQLWGVFRCEKLHFYHQGARSSYMNAQNKEKHGLITALWYSIQDHQCIIVETTTATYQPQDQRQSIKQMNYLPRM